jgi:hypothetical protein
VAGVETDADAGFVFNLINNLGEVLEAETEIGALARRVFDDGGYAAGLIQRPVDRFGDGS